MRENFDCALLIPDGCETWAAEWEGRHARGRLRIQQLAGASRIDTQAEGATLALKRMAVTLKAYDACLLPVFNDNLAWARVSLSRARCALNTPVIVLAMDLRAVALCDLIRIGVADFIRTPICMEELRARLEKIHFRLRGQSAAYWNLSAYPSMLSSGTRYSQVLNEPPQFTETDDTSLAGMTEIIEQADESVLQRCLQRKGGGLKVFATAAAQHCATAQLSFKEAKGQVVAGFEQAYISAVLGRCSGNVAQAARYCDKHRRAFWALVRKHNIDATQYRDADRPIRRRGR